MPRHRPLIPPLWATLALMPALAAAQAGASKTDDTFTLRAGLTTTRDDNFRQAPAGEQESETILGQTLGIKASIPISLQRIELDAEITNNQHQNFSGFDFVGQNLRAAWNWSYTPRIYGSVFYTRNVSLNAIEDSLDPNQRNKNTTTAAGVAATYGLSGQWQLIGSLLQSDSKNEQALLGSGDSNGSAAVAGVRYALPTGTLLGYDLRHDSGNASSTQADGTLLSSSYTSLTHDLSLIWRLSDATSLDLHLLHLTNRYAQEPRFDFSGAAGSAKLNLKPSAKTSLALDWQRTLTSNQTENSVYTMSDSFGIAPRWDITPKTALKASYKTTRLTDRGSPLPDVATSNRKETTRTGSIGLSWQPRPFVSIALDHEWTERTSNQPDADYVVNRTKLSANFTF